MALLGIGYQNKWTSICVVHENKVVQLTNFYNERFDDIAYTVNKYVEIYNVNKILLDKTESDLFEELCKEVGPSKVYQYVRDKQRELELYDILKNNSFVKELGYNIYTKQPDVFGDRRINRNMYTDSEIATLDAIGWAFYQKEEIKETPKSSYDFTYFISYHYETKNTTAFGNAIIGRKTEIKTTEDIKDIESEIRKKIKETIETDGDAVILNYKRME